MNRLIVSLALMTCFMSAYADENINTKGNNEVPGGALGGVVLNVSKSSLEYWGEVETRAIPVFVGADIAGAVAGACYSITGSYLFNKEVDWKMVAWSAGTGAITGSTGIAGKVGRWLSGFF